MTPEQAKEILKARKAAQQSQGIENPNPAKLKVKWKHAPRQEVVKLGSGQEAMATIQDGGFFYQQKKEDGRYDTIKIPQKKFALAVIDHSIVQIEGGDFEGGRMIRSYWTNELRQKDTFTTPFSLRIKSPTTDGKSNIKSFFGTTKELKESHDLRGRCHVIYGLLPSGEMVRLTLPYYSYSLGSSKFQTHGDTLLDADASSVKNGLGGMESCFLTYDGFHVLKTGETQYTAPKFRFTEKMNDEMIVALVTEGETFDKWYNSMYSAHCKQIDKSLDGNQGESQHGSENQDIPRKAVDGSENQDIPLKSAEQSATGYSEDDSSFFEDEDEIPF